MSAEDDRPFQCNICQKRFKSKGTLHSHKYTHSSGPQKCTQCDKISPNINALRTHVRSVHCDSIYKCHICEKSFKLQTLLRVTFWTNRVFGSNTWGTNRTFISGSHWNAQWWKKLQVRVLRWDVCLANEYVHASKKQTQGGMVGFTRRKRWVIEFRIRVWFGFFC